MVNDKYVGKVVLVNLPKTKVRYRWIVKNDDGRYIARARLGVLIRDLHKKLEKDFSSEHLLPKNFSFLKSERERRIKGSCQEIIFII